MKLDILWRDSSNLREYVFGGRPSKPHVLVGITRSYTWFGGDHSKLQIFHVSCCLEAELRFCMLHVLLSDIWSFSRREEVWTLDFFPMLRLVFWSWLGRRSQFASSVFPDVPGTRLWADGIRAVNLALAEGVWFFAHAYYSPGDQVENLFQLARCNAQVRARRKTCSCHEGSTKTKGPAIVTNSRLLFWS